jgi:hypothetical protein
MDNVDIDLSKGPEKGGLAPPVLEPWHPEKAEMRLAYWVLGSIFFIFLLNFLSNYLAKVGLIETSFSAALFELCKTGLLPMVTFILGYYFSKV